MSLFISFGEPAWGTGSGYVSEGRFGITSKSVGTYKFVAENGKPYTTGFSHENEHSHWPNRLLIYYQKGFPQNNTAGEPSIQKILIASARPLIFGMGLAIFCFYTIPRVNDSKKSEKTW